MNGNPRPRRGTGAILIDFLGSMNLAITLLVAISIAAVIGTVLQQNQPYNDYVIKFGPFWFEVFAALGLFDIYGAPWFLLLLGFLLVSTAACVWRQGPGIIRDMRQYRLDVQEKSLRGFRHRGEWTEGSAPADLLGRYGALLQRAGYRVRSRDHGDHLLLAGMKGATGRLGYLLSHIAIVVICLGGLIDGNLPLKASEYTGAIRAETRDLPVAEVPPESVLAPDTASFRGSVNIPEGSSADFVFLGLGDGYLVQKLPFTVALEDFRIEHYPTGQPKSFESDIVIMDEELKEPLRKTIAVNHPLVYKGYAIYQSSFSDGGSRIRLAAHPLDLPDAEPLMLEGRIGQRIAVETPRGRRSVELIDFKPFNIFPLGEEGKDGKKFHNYGPSVIFKVRDTSGQALEYVNYMVPIQNDGQSLLLSGVRSSPAEEYRYLHIPVDEDGSIKRFMALRSRVLDKARVRKVIDEQLSGMAEASPDPAFARRVGDSIAALVDVFAREGIDAVVAQAEATASEGEQQKAIDSYIKVIENTLASLFVQMLAEEGVDLEKGPGPEADRFFDASMNALSLIGAYGSPFLARFADFEQVEASGLQITRSPGKDIVYLGCIMLMAGVFFMFYIHHRRVWVRIAPDGSGSRVLLAASGHRQRTEFDHEFEALRRRLSGAQSATEESH